MLVCMRTTLDIDDQLLRAARERARSGGKTLTAVVEEALAALLTARPPKGKRYRLRWKTFSGKPLPGVDLADRDSLHDVMDGRR